MTMKERTHALRMLGPEPVEITLHINGQVSPLLLDPRTSLLDALREHLDLAGTKYGSYYVFAGTASGKPGYTSAAPGAYQGNSDGVLREVSPGAKMTVNVDPRATFDPTKRMP